MIYPDELLYPDALFYVGKAANEGTYSEAFAGYQNMLCKEFTKLRLQMVRLRTMAMHRLALAFALQAIRVQGLRE